MHQQHNTKTKNAYTDFLNIKYDINCNEMKMQILNFNYYLFFSKFQSLFTFLISE